MRCTMNMWRPGWRQRGFNRIAQGQWHQPSMLALLAFSMHSTTLARHFLLPHVRDSETMYPVIILPNDDINNAKTSHCIRFFVVIGSY